MNTSSGVAGVPAPLTITQSDASSSFSLVFTVDAIEQVLISGTASLDLQSNLATPDSLSQSSGDGAQTVSLTGPGVDFEASIPALNVSFGSDCLFSEPGCQSMQTIPIDSVLTLAPGQYTLLVSTDASVGWQSEAIGGMSDSSSLSLLVAFPGATIPEPAMLPVLLLLLAGLVWRRRASGNA